MVLIKTPPGKIYKVVLAYISVVFSLFQHILEAYPIPFTNDAYYTNSSSFLSVLLKVMLSYVVGSCTDQKLHF